MSAATEHGRQKVRRVHCEGSGGRPAELVILDTVPGVEPKGTCPMCGKSLHLSMYRLPEHAESEAS